MSNLALNRSVPAHSWGYGREFNPSVQRTLPGKAQHLMVISDPCVFQKRTFLPLEARKLWRIEQGFVKTALWNEAGECLLLGIWGKGDVVGQSLSSNVGYHIECLTRVTARDLLADAINLPSIMTSQLQQMEFLLDMMHCNPMPKRMMKFLDWLGQKVGQVTEAGCIIDLSLTHQDIADMVGTTRVTVTRLLQKLEAEGQLVRLRRHRLLLVTADNRLSGSRDISAI